MSTAVVDPRQLGGRIAKWRERLGLTPEWVGEASGIEAERCRAIEAGSRVPSTWDLFRIAGALGTDPAMLVRPGDALGHPTRGTARFRDGGSFDDLPSTDRRLLSVAAEAGRVGYALCQWLAVAPSKTHPGSTPLAGAAWQQGHELGEAARAELEIPAGPIPSVTRTLESLGVHVAHVDFESEEIEAVSLFEKAALPVILVNQSSSRVRSARPLRSVLAHELCHLLHDATEHHVVTMVTRRSEHDVDVERRANAFAPSFLAPASMLGEVEPGGLVRELVERWGFSLEGASWHVKNVQRLSEAAAQELRHEACGRLQFLLEPDERVNAGEGALPVEPGPLVRGRLSRLVAQALEAGHLTEGRAVEILRMR